MDCLLFGKLVSGEGRKRGGGGGGRGRGKEIDRSLVELFLISKLNFPPFLSHSFPSLSLFLSLSSLAGLQHSLRVPHVYTFSETLVPRPPDWGEEVDICGFLFPPSLDSVNSSSRYEPPEGNYCYCYYYYL